MYQNDNDFHGALLFTGDRFGNERTLYANLRAAPGQEAALEAVGVIPTNQWTFVAVTYDNETGQGRLYVNDEIVQESVLPIHNPNTSGSLYVGYCPPSLEQIGDRPFHGGIDEPMVFNRALTSAELNEIYAAGSTGLCREPGLSLSFPIVDPLLIATNDLVAAYPLDGTGDDISGNEFDGVVFGTTPATDRFGRTNGAIRVSSTNDYVDLGNRPEFNFTNGFTLNAWVKTEQAPGGYVIGKYNYFDPGNLQSHSYGLGTHDFLGPYGFVLGEGVAYQDVVAGPNLNDGQWHALTLTFEDGVGLRLYADGQLQGTRATGDLPPLTNSLPLMIGKIASGLPFIGSIDDVSIYNRPLDNDEVRLLHVFQRYYSAETPVLLQQPTATFSQTEFGEFSVARVTDGIIDSTTAWGISPAITNQTAVFETASEVGFEGGTVLNFKLVFNHPSVPSSTSHALGRFRLSATTDSRDSFADGLATEGDVSANWSDLTILSAAATSGATMTVQPDNSILVSGNLSLLDTYTITTATRLTGITGLRLEVLTDPSLPFNGPGREPLNGNFALSEMLVAARPGGAPLITNEPSSITVTNGASAEFTVAASSSLPFTYQWFLNGAAIPDATNATLTITNAQDTDAGTYTVQLDNAEGTSLSAGAVLNVVPPDVAGLARLFVSNFEPTNAPIYDISGDLLDGPAFLARVYSGPTAESLVAQGPAVPFLSGESAGFFQTIDLVLTNVAAGSNAFVQIRVWESTASTYEQAVSAQLQRGESVILESPTGGDALPAPQLAGLTSFSLVAEPRIVSQPSSQSVLVGQAAAFQVNAWGPALNYQWFLNSNSIAGATSASVTLTNLQVEHSGEIYVVVTNSVGSVTSAVTTLLVQVPDTTPPEIAFTAPTVGSTHETAITLSGSIADDRGVSSAHWSHNGSSPTELNLASGQFSVANIPLVRGANTFRVTAVDTSGNSSFSEVTVTNVASRLVYVDEIAPQQEGATVAVPLYLQSRGDVGGVSFNLIFARDFLADPEVQWEAAIAGAVTQSNTNTLGTVRGSFALSGGAVNTGAVHFATVFFRSRSVPSTRTLQFGLSVSGLFTPTGDPLSPVGTDVLPGSVQITVRKVKGDNNANDRLDVGDASTIMRFDNLLEFPRQWDIPKNDLNGNFQLDTGDVIRVLRVVVGLDPQPTIPGLQALAAAGLRALNANGQMTLQIDKSTAAPGEQVKVTVNLSQITKPLAAASFRLTYPTNALRLLNASAHSVGNIVPGGAAHLWNVAPSQNDYDAQNGSVSLAVTSDRAWSTNQGVLAELIFTVQPGATNQHLWGLALSDAEVSSGYDLITAAGSEISFIGRAAVPPQFEAQPTMTDEGLSLTIAAENGLTYRIEASEDLVTWVPVTTLTSEGSSIQFTDPISAESTQRFYRAVQVE